MKSARQDARDAMQRVSAALRAYWNPMGCGDVPDLPDDEYTAYAGPLLSLIGAGADDVQIANYLSDVERDTMGLAPRPPAALMHIAAQVRAAASGQN